MKISTFNKNPYIKNHNITINKCKVKLRNQKYKMMN